jgi:diguanylate cyclase (GGDEF)-like protein
VLIGTIGSGRDITAQIMLEKENEKLAYYDQLTGLPNRQKILIDIQKRNPIACVIFNIDDFKEINDFFGTENGDKILQDIAKWFSKLDLEVYRIDGDEFAILYYEDISLETIEHNVKNILALFEEELFHVQKERIQVTFSVGIAKEKYRLFIKADIAVNYAKEHKIKIAIYKEDANIEEKYKKKYCINNNHKRSID